MWSTCSKSTCHVVFVDFGHLKLRKSISVNFSDFSVQNSPFPYFTVTTFSTALTHSGHSPGSIVNPFRFLARRQWVWLNVNVCLLRLTENGKMAKKLKDFYMKMCFWLSPYKIWWFAWVFRKLNETVKHNILPFPYVRILGPFPYDLRKFRITWDVCISN